MFVREGDSEPLTTSLHVAKRYGKTHFHVLRDIEGILKEHPELDAPFLFREGEYISRQNKKVRMFEMNEQAFTVLAMGFTGAEALRLRIAYITLR